MQNRYAQIMILCGMFCVACGLQASEGALQPVGYIFVPVEKDLLDQQAQVADAERPASAVCAHGEASHEATEGLPVYAGDVVSTTQEGSIAVAFLDGSVVTLNPSSRLTVTAYAYPRKETPTHLLLQQGGAFFAVAHRPGAAHFFVETERQTEIEVKGTKFVVVTNTQADGTFETTVAVSNGQVTAQPNGAQGVQLFAGNLLTLTMATTAVNGYSGAPVTFQKGNISAQQLKTLVKNAVADITVSTAANGTLTIQATTENPDGTTTTLKRTEINGVVISETITTKEGKQIIDSLTEKSGTVITKQTLNITAPNGTTVSQATVTSTTKNGQTTVSVTTTLNGKKTTLKGTGITEANGTEVLTATDPKTGTQIIITEATQADGTTVTNTVVTPIGAPTGTETTTTKSPTGAVTVTQQNVNTKVQPNGTFTPVTGAPTIFVGSTPPQRPTPPSISSPGGPITFPTVSP